MRIILCIIISFFSFFVTDGQAIAKERIAVMDFEVLTSNKDFEEYKWMSIGFSETLSDVFSRVDKFSVIERSQLSKVLNEQKLQNVNYFDTSSIIKAGRILGVNKILLGSCQIYTGHILVNMRIVNVETAEVYPIKNLPIITPINEVFQMQKDICFEILKQFNVSQSEETRKEINLVTTNSTNNINAFEFLNRGIEFYQNGQYSEALQMYGFALNYDKKYRKAYYRRGLANYELRQFEAAANDFESSVGYLKEDTVYVLMSDAYYKAGDYKKANTYIKKAEKINPNSGGVKSGILRLSRNKLGSENSYIKPADTTKFQTVFEFNDGRAKVKQNYKFGYIDTLNNIVIPIIFDEIREFKNGKAAVKQGAKWGYINYNGEYVIQPKYSEVIDFNVYDLAVVMIKKKWGVINSKERIIIPIEFTTYYLNGLQFEDSLIIVSKPKGLLGLTDVYGVYDITGREIIPLVYDYIEFPQREYNFQASSHVYNPYLYASLDGKWGMISKTNDIVIPFKYANKDCIRKFSKGYAAVKVNERWGFVNAKGLEVIIPIYDNVKERTSEFFEVKFRGKWGLIDSSNNQIISCNYDKIEYLDKEFWAVKKGIKWGIVSLGDKIICDFIYDAMASEIGSHNIIVSDFINKQKLKTVVRKDSKQYWINDKCECIYGCD